MYFALNMDASGTLENDKERVIAALENPTLRQHVDECIYSNEI